MTLTDIVVSRFFSRISNYSKPDACWIWVAGRDRSRNYGHFHGLGISTNAHRWIWCYLFGIPHNKQVIHHRCSNKLCVNPSHLECMSKGTHNSLHKPLKTHCSKGHELSGSNLYIWYNEHKCKACGNLRSKKYQERKRNA